MTPPPEGAARCAQPRARVAEFRRRAGRVAWCSSTTPAAASTRCCARSSSSPATRSCSTDHAYGGVARARRLHRQAARGDGRDRRRCRFRRATRPATCSALARGDHAAHPAGAAPTMSAPRRRSSCRSRRSAAACRREGRARCWWTARACPGRRSRVDIAALEVDWYAANLHKWCVRAAQLRRPVGGAGRGRRRCIRRSSPGASPTTTGCRSSRWTGTRDPRPGWRRRPASPSCTTCSAWRRCAPGTHDLAWRSAAAPGRALGHALDHAGGDGRLHGHRAAAGAARAGQRRQRPAAARRPVLPTTGIEAPVIARGGALWARLRRCRSTTRTRTLERFAVAVAIPGRVMAAR